MLDFFEEAPAYQWMTEHALERGREEGSLLTARQNIEAVVRARFPRLLPQVRERIEQIDDLEKLQEILLTMSTARTAKSAREYLLTL
jgi:hypothetical protein